nr:tetratricopeptide repeat protein [Desulfoluna limicola]
MKQGAPKEAFRAYMNVVEKQPNHNEAHFNLSKLYLLAKQSDEAKNHIQTALANDPDNIEYLLVSAALLAVTGAEDNSLEVYGHVLNIQPDEVRAFRGIAQVRMKQGDYSGAEAALREGLLVVPESVRVRLDLVNFYNSAQQYEQAEQELRILVGKHRENLGLLLVLGDFLMAREKITAATEAYLDASNADKTSVAPILKLAELYEKTGERDNAKGMFNKALEMNPDDQGIQVALAQFYLKHDELAKSREMVTVVLDKDPGFLPALTLRGALELKDNELDSAVKTLTLVVSDDPKNTKAYYLRGIAYMALGSDDLGRKDVLRALELDPSHLQAQIALSDFYYRAHEYTLAKDTLNKILEKRTDIYKVSLLMGHIHAATGDLDEALEAYGALMTQAPENPLAFYHSGMIYLRKGQYDAAQENLAKARKLNPRMMDAFTGMVRCYVLQHEPRKALALCDEQLAAVDTPADVSRVYGVMGRLYVTTGDLDNAEEAYREAIATNPDVTRPYYGLAEVYQRRGEMDRVLAQFQLAAEKNKHDPLPHVIMGIMNESKGDVESSKVCYRNALAIRKDNVAAANNLAYILAEQNHEIDEALELAREAKSNASDDPSIMDTLGLVYYRKGLYDSAISEFKDSLEKLPENPVVNYHLGLALHASGNIEKARASLVKALQLNPDFKGADEARGILAQN